MEQTIEHLIEETIASYYEYIVKIEDGSKAIVSAIHEEEYETAVVYLRSLSEGLIWILETEALMEIHLYHIESPVGQVVPLFEKVNHALEQGQMQVVSQVLEEEFIPVFKNAKEWRFKKVVS